MIWFLRALGYLVAVAVGLVVGSLIGWIFTGAFVVSTLGSGALVGVVCAGVFLAGDYLRWKRAQDEV